MRSMAHTSRRAGRLLLLALSCAAAACDDPGRPEQVGTLELVAPSEYLDMGRAVSLVAEVADPAGAELAAPAWSGRAATRPSPRSPPGR